jgi:hypothetical protein
VKEALERIEVPGAEAARERSRGVVLAAFAEREGVPWPRRRIRGVVIAVAAAALLGAALATPPGRAVLDEVREAVGVEGAQPALFRLPAGGRLLVASDAGVWVVAADGSKRLLGPYREASWSPFGRFVVAARRTELAALEPDGNVRWTLSRPDVRFPRWAGTRTDTRIVYLSAGSLRVVAGDGKGDRLLRTRVRSVAPAWRPRGGFVATYVDRSGAVVTEDLERRIVHWRRSYASPVLELAWSSDGRRLIVRQADRVDVLTRDGSPFTGLRTEGATVTASAVRPELHESTHALTSGGQAQVLHLGEPGGRLFTAAGRFSHLGWSPDGRWLLIGWPMADQWVFVRADGGGIRAVSNVSNQFRSRAFPRVGGWCCHR